MFLAWDEILHMEHIILFKKKERAFIQSVVIFFFPSKPFLPLKVNEVVLNALLLCFVNCFCDLYVAVFRATEDMCRFVRVVCINAL